MPLISHRLDSFDSSDFRNIMMRKHQLNNPIDLSIGTPEEVTAPSVKTAGINAITADKTTYAPANGILELREAIARKLRTENNIATQADRVTVVPGLTTGLLLLYMAILDAGDEVLIMDPSYPPYEHLATVVGAKAVKVQTLPSFHLDIPAIEASITSQTRAIILNTPNNPTGAVYPKEDLIKVAKLAEQYDIWLISDEIYEHFVYEGTHVSIASIYPNVITMNGFSKSYAMTGWRLGYISGPRQIIDALNELQQYTVFSSSTIAQYAAIEAISHPPVADPKSYKRKRDLVLKRMVKMGYELHGAEGAYYAFFQVPHGLTDLEFVELAAKQNTLLVPGRAFSSSHTFVRLSYGTSYDQLEKGLDILENLTKGSTIEP